jgi:hypothetical protein
MQERMHMRPVRAAAAAKERHRRNVPWRAAVWQLAATEGDAPGPSKPRRRMEAATALGQMACMCPMLVC